MQISWRKNPKTEDGWARRTAISLLAALGCFVLSLPILFLLLLNHLQHAYPNDPQNFLGALTTAVLIGLALAALAFLAAMMLLFLFGSLRKPVPHS